MSFSTPILEVKRLLLDALAIEGLTAEALPDDMPLFQGGLGLDSIDILELCMAVQNRFGVRISQDEALLERLGTPRDIAALVSGALPTGTCEAS